VVSERRSGELVSLHQDSRAHSHSRYAWATIHEIRAIS